MGIEGPEERTRVSPGQHWLTSVCVTAARIVVEAQGPPPRCPALLPTRKWGQPPGAREFGASGLET